MENKNASRELMNEIYVFLYTSSLLRITVHLPYCRVNPKYLDTYLLTILVLKLEQLHILLPVYESENKTAGRVANSVHADQRQYFEASDLHLHCLLRPV